MNFGDRIKELRKAKGASQRDLAAQAGIDFTYLSKIENSKMHPPSEKVIRAMAEALDADADELTVLAGKVPSDITERLMQSTEAIKLLRSLPGNINSREDFRKALRERLDQEG